MLRAYLRRGLRVRLHTQVLAVDVRRRTPSRLRLVVTDRLVGATAVGVGTRVPLPRDGPSTRTVVLRRVDGTWLVARVLASRVIPR
jgi:hypothetical protein